MDWTLAQYNVEFDLLAYNGAKEKLVNLMGYPKEVLQLEYLPNMCRRGCVIDKKRGNILKLDRHKYVTDAEHGMTELSREQRKSLYRQTFQELQHFGGSNFVCMDTPFSLVDCCLFAQLVDLRDQLLLSGNSVVDGTFPASYEQIWNDMRSTGICLGTDPESLDRDSSGWFMCSREKMCVQKEAAGCAVVVAEVVIATFSDTVLRRTPLGVIRSEPSGENASRLKKQGTVSSAYRLLGGDLVPMTGGLSTLEAVTGPSVPTEGEDPDPSIFIVKVALAPSFKGVPVLYLN
eukprot:gene42087-55863_t